MSAIRLVIGCLFTAVGLICVVTSVIGVYRFKFCLNRLHASAIGDTAGVLFFTIGMIILNGFSFVSLKMLLVILLFWIGCPVTSHVLVKLELNTDADAQKEFEETHFASSDGAETKEVGRYIENREMKETHFASPDGAETKEVGRFFENREIKEVSE